MLWFGTLVLAVIVVGLLLAAAHYAVATARLRSVMAQLEAESIPTSWAGLLAQFPDVDSGLAAQPAFFAALDMLDDVPELSESQREALPLEGDAELPEPGEPLPPEMLASIDARLRDAAPVLTAIRAAVRDEPIWLVAPEDGQWLPELSRLTKARRTAMLFYLSAVLHAERGEAEAAMGSVVDALRLARVLHRGSLMIDELVRSAIEKLALGSLQYVLARTDPPPDELRSTASLLSERSDLRSALLGEAVYAKQSYDMLASSREERASALDVSDSQLWPWVAACLPFLPGWLRMNEAYHLRLLLEIIRASDLPWEDFTRRYDNVCDAIPRFYFLPTASIGYDAFRRAELLTLGAWRVARIGIAIEEYSQRHGHLPVNLAELVPEHLATLPAEPFHGGPFSHDRQDAKAELSFPCPGIVRPHTFRVAMGRGDGQSRRAQ